MVTPINQRTIRCNNIKLLMGLLSRGAFSCKELSERIDLSDVAINKIIREMLAMNLVKIKEDDGSEKHIGRRHIRYNVNGSYGCYVVMNTTIPFQSYSIYDFSGKRILWREFSTHTFKIIMSEFDEVVDQMARDVRATGLRPLMAAVAVMGQVNKDKKLTVSYAFEDFIAADVSPADIISEKLGCETVIDNNVHFIASGAVLSNDELRDEVVAYIYNGFGTSMCVMHGGLPVIGRSGGAGEIGLSVLSDDERDRFSVRVSMNMLRVHFSEILGKKIESKDIFDVYRENSGNAKMKEVVLNSATALGCYVNGVINAIGPDLVMIGGECKNFGDEYLSAVRAINDTYGIFKCDIRYDHDDDSMTTGMLDRVRTAVIDGILDEIRRDPAPTWE